MMLKIPKKFCVDCRYVERHDDPKKPDGTRYECHRQNRWDVVTGRPSFEECWMVRGDHNQCGYEGKWWDGSDEKWKEIGGP